jgi:hypothetical protein
MIGGGHGEATNGAVFASGAGSTDCAERGSRRDTKLNIFWVLAKAPLFPGAAPSVFWGN